jgi:hypothetical protein
MTELVQKEEKETEVLMVKAYERRECRNRTVVSVKVAMVKHPPPRRVRLHIKFKDGSEKAAKAHLVSAYSNYAYYYLDAAYARELAPLVGQIQEVRVYEEKEETQ